MVLVVRAGSIVVRAGMMIVGPSVGAVTTVARVVRAMLRGGRSRTGMSVGSPSVRTSGAAGGATVVTTVVRAGMIVVRGATVVRARVRALTNSGR
ncbi:hypothetical protein, partial [Nonomuraea sp. NPDC059022]|uniref:hypothetical protein n=1 Tax=Nonomuraea sp. NPDC059022 TaxID=3346705 RepID=UPI0036C1CE89